MERSKVLSMAVLVAKLLHYGSGTAAATASLVALLRTSCPVGPRIALVHALESAEALSEFRARFPHDCGMWQ